MKMSEFGKYKQRHNGDHEIHVTLWWRHVKHRHCRGRVASLPMRGSQQVADRTWINSRSRRHYSGHATFGHLVWQGGIMLDFQNYCGHPIVTNDPLPCKIVRSSGKVVGSHFDWVGNSPHRIPIKRVPLNWIRLWCIGVITCNSLLIFLESCCEVLWVTALVVILMVVVFKLAVGSANFRKWKLRADSKSTQEYTIYVCSMFSRHTIGNLEHFPCSVLYFGRNL